MTKAGIRWIVIGVVLLILAFAYDHSRSSILYLRNESNLGSRQVKVTLDDHIVFDDTLVVFYIPLHVISVNTSVGSHVLRISSGEYLVEEVIYSGFDKYVLIDFREDDDGNNTGFYVSKTLTQVYYQ